MRQLKIDVLSVLVVTDTEITATGGEIPGTISGTSSVEVKDGGPTTLSGDNSYTF